MARVNLPASQPFYSAAQRFVDVVLRGDDSLFAPGHPIWSLATLNKLHHDFVEQPDTSSRSFEAKFKDQLANSDPETILLAGELLYVHLLPANGIKPETKRGQIRRVLSWAREPITTSIPQELDQALENGVAKASQAFLVGKPFQIGFLLDVVRQWKQLPDDQRSRALADPWEFKRFVFGLPIQFAYAQRELLLHIVYPDTFEATMAREHKQQITASFANLIDNNVPDVDQRLVQIRLKLDPTYGQGFSFYEERLKAQWLDIPDDEDEIAGEPDDIEVDFDVHAEAPKGGTDLDALRAWQAQFQSENPISRRVAAEYPQWLLETFGNRVTVETRHERGLFVYVDGAIPGAVGQSRSGSLRAAVRSDTLGYSFATHRISAPAIAQAARAQRYAVFCHE